MIQPEPRLLMVCWPLVVTILARQRIQRARNITESECRPIYAYAAVRMCVLCPTRVPPEIKTCNFVQSYKRRSRVRPTIDEILPGRGASRSHVKNCFPTGRERILCIYRPTKMPNYTVYPIMTVRVSEAVCACIIYTMTMGGSGINASFHRVPVNKRKHNKTYYNDNK